MKYKILVGICILFCILCSSTVFAVSDSDLYPHLIAQYKIDEGSGSNLEDNVNSYNMTIYSTGTWVKDLNGVAGEAWWGNAAGDYAQTNGNHLNHVATICAWTNLTTIGTNAFITLSDGSDEDNRLEFDLSGNKIQMYHNDGEGDTYNFAGNTVLSTNTWYHWCLTANSTKITIYLNAAHDGDTPVEANGIIIDPDADYFTISGAYYHNGVLQLVQQNPTVFDVVQLFSKNLTKEEVTYLYNTGTPKVLAAGGGSGAGGDVVVNLTKPVDNAVNGSNSINFTYSTYSDSDGGTLDTCQVYTNSSGWANNYTESSPVNNTNNSAVITLPEGDYIWNVWCNDSVGNSSWAANNYTLSVDTTSPTISTTFENNFFAFASGFGGPQNISGVINITDGNLYSINISTDVEQIFYNLSYSGNFLEYNLSHNVSGYSPGVHNLTIRAADGHTAKAIPNYNFREGINSLTFDFKEKNIMFFEKDYLLINVEGISGDLAATKESDRYTFEYSDQSPFDSISFIVESDHFIDIVHEKYGYSGHLIVPGLDKWIDFEPEDPSGKEKYDITRVSPTEVKVRITGLKTAKKAKFRSVGDLNVNTIVREFYIINGTETYSSPVLEGTTNTFNLNFTANQTYTISAFLYYNNTKYTATKTTTNNSQLFTTTATAPTPITVQENVSFHWNYTITSPADSQSNQTSELNQTVDQIVLDDCSSYKTVAYNFTILDEESHERIKANITARVDYSTGVATGNLSTTFTNQNNFSICMNPSYANTTGDFNIQYEAGSNVRNWIKANQTIDNVTNYVSLYLLTSTATEITVHVIDTYGDDIQGVNVEAHRWNQSNNNFYIVETETTDGSGNVILDLSKGDAFYKFLLYQNGVLELETERFKLFTTSYEYVIGDVQSTPIAGWLLAKRIASDMAFDNTTLTFEFNWTDYASVATNYCLNITYDNRTPLSFQCNTSSSGRIRYAVGNNASYTAQGMARISGSYRVLETLSVNLAGIWRNLGQSLSIFISAIFLMVLSLIGLASPKMAVALGSVGFIGLYFLGLVPLGMMGVMSVVLVGLILIIIMKERLTT